MNVQEARLPHLAVARGAELVWAGRDTAIGEWLLGIAGFRASTLCFGLLTSFFFGVVSALVVFPKDRSRQPKPLLPATMIVVLLAPGLILPPAGKGEDWMDRLRKTNPLEARGTAEDVADAVLYLTSAKFVTGQVLFVDGGRHLKGSRYGN